MLVLNRLFNRPPDPSDAELAAYAAIVEPILDRAERLYGQWFEQAALFVNSEKLANAAAIHRWQIATMKQAVERATPPPALASAHAELIRALQVASRAAQLLSRGSRFHNASAVCDGHTLLEEARQQRLAAERQIRRLLDRSGDGDEDGPGGGQGDGDTPPEPTAQDSPPKPEPGATPTPHQPARDDQETGRQL